MRAVVYEGAGGVEVIAVRDDVPQPVPGEDDALVAVAYAGLNRADLLERMGYYPMPPQAIAIAGLEFSGTVRAVGSRVRGVAPGDRVCGLVQRGAQAEFVAVQALTLSKLPDGVTLRTAGAIPEAFTTARDALFTRGGFTLGQTVVVHAVGSGVGLAAVSLAKRAGGYTIGTSRTEAKLSRAQDYGLDLGLSLDEQWVGRALAATNGRGADVILDFVGAPVFDANLKVLAGGGRIVQIGTMGGALASVNLGVLMTKRAALHGTVLRSRPLDEKIALAKQFTRELLPLFERNELQAAIDRVFPLEDIRAAHEYLESNASFGKVLLAIGTTE